MDRCDQERFAIHPQQEEPHLQANGWKSRKIQRFITWYSTTQIAIAGFCLLHQVFLALLKFIYMVPEDFQSIIFELLFTLFSDLDPIQPWF